MKENEQKSSTRQEFKEKITDLNNNEEFQFWITPEEDERFCHNTDIKIARREGREEGHASGLVEGQTKIIRSLFESGMSIEQISKATKISKKEIEELVK